MTVLQSGRPGSGLRGDVSKGTDAPGPANYAGSMLQTIAVILLILWLLGAVSSYTIGGFIHILLVIAIVLFLVRLVQGRRIP